MRDFDGYLERKRARHEKRQQRKDALMSMLPDGPEGMRPKEEAALVSTDPGDLVPAGVKPEVQEAIQRAGGLVQAIEELTVAGPDNLTTMDGLRVEAQTALKMLETKRTELLAPMKEAQDRLREFFRPAIKGLEGAKKLSGGKMTTFRQYVADRERKERAEAERTERARREQNIAKLRTDAEEEEAEGHTQTAAALRDTAREQARAPMAAPPAKLEETKTEGTHYRKTYLIHVDAEAVMKKLTKAISAYNQNTGGQQGLQLGTPDTPMLGPENFTINEKQIQQTADNTKGAIPIPDVTVELVEVPITRGRKT